MEAGAALVRRNATRCRTSLHSRIRQIAFEPENHAADLLVVPEGPPEQVPFDTVMTIARSPDGPCRSCGAGRSRGPRRAGRTGRACRGQKIGLIGFSPRAATANSDVRTGPIHRARQHGSSRAALRHALARCHRQNDGACDQYPFHDFAPALIASGSGSGCVRAATVGKLRHLPLPRHASQVG